MPQPRESAQKGVGGVATVWKFPIGYGPGPSFALSIPANAQPLRVDFATDGQLVLWALVDPTAEPQPATITIIGTGQPLPSDPGTYVTTFRSEPFVFHAFYKG